MNSLRIAEKQEAEVMTKSKESFKCSIHVLSLSNIGKKEARGIIHAYEGKYFKEPITGEVKITYPLGVDVYLKIKNCKTVGELLWDVSQAYIKIYKHPEKYRIWGHKMDDLYFERIEISRDGNVELGMGS